MSINIETISEDLRALTSSEWEEILPVIQAEAERRYTIGSFEEQAAELQAKYQAATGVLKGRGDEYRQPQGAHDSYKPGDVVKHAGKFYRSLIPFNAWSPSEYPAGWEEIAEGDLEPGTGEPTELEYPAYEVGVQYKQGDRIIFEDAVYEVLQAHTSAAHWPPSAAHSLYTKVSS